MTSPQTPRPPHSAAPGPGVNEETLHLPTTTVGSMAAQAPSAPSRSPSAGPQQRTAPSPYPQRPAFRPPPQPSNTGGHPRQAAQPLPEPQPLRWEGVGFRPDIQGLRAVAVVLVLLSHAGYGFAKGGYVGVDVFFVLSGFLITSLLVKEAFETGRISIAGFYARRARRILPAASLVTIATVFGAWLWFPVTRLEAVMQDAFTVIVYVVNYRFVSEQTEYLNADQMPSPFQQFWSLAVEEQFYVVWPLLLIGLMFLAGRSPRKLVSAGIAMAVVVFAISLFLSVLITERSQPTAYYAAHTRAWELAAGAILALALPTLKKTPKATAWVLGILGLAAIVVSGVTYTDETPFPGYTALLPVVGTMLVIAAGSGPGTNPTSTLLGTGPFQFLGKISYSLYLWHWPILILIPLAVGAESSVVLNTVLLLGTIAVSQFSYRYVEEPIRNARFLKAGNLWGLGIGVVCSVLSIGLIITLTTAFSKTDEDAGPADLEAVEQTANADVLTEKLREGLEVETVPDDLTPSLSGAAEDEPATYGDDCHGGYDEVAPPDDCVYGDPDSDIDVVLFGDSHAAQWFPALESIAEERGWRLLPITKSACTPVSVHVESTQHAGEYTECWEWKQAVFDRIDALQPELVVISNEDATALFEVDDADRLEAWSTGWDDTLDRVTAAAGAVVTLADTPRASTETAAPDCLAINEEAVRDCLADNPYKLRAVERREAGREANERAGAEYVDTEPWFCVDEQCPLIVDHLLVYRDSHHISTAYAQSVAAVLGERLPELTAR
jgi:peptidoglycan/LPS O-acetylase OafA/YrhL